MATIEARLNARSKPHQRYRTSDGAIVPGVTTILGVIAKPELISWANLKGLEGVDTRKFVDQTAIIGTLAHEMIQENLGGPAWDRSGYTPDQIEIAENSFRKYLEWHQGKELATRMIEEQLVSERFRFGGTCDWYGLMDGKFWLMDIKTSKAIREEYVYQAAAYRKLLIENGYPVDRVGILRVGRNEGEGFEFRAVGKKELSAGWTVFTSALKLYLAIKEFKRGNDM